MLNINRRTGGVFRRNNFVQQTVADRAHHRTGFAEQVGPLRQQLLAVKGIGPETADSILLYAANQPVFVVDTYTHRILSRHQLIDENAGYSDIQELFMDNLEADAHLFNEYHALLVRVGNRFCKKQRPDCDTCPLAGL